MKIIFACPLQKKSYQCIIALIRQLMQLYRAEETMENTRKYKRVYLIGVDGAGIFFKDTATPSIDRIF